MPLPSFSIWSTCSPLKALYGAAACGSCEWRGAGLSWGWAQLCSCVARLQCQVYCLCPQGPGRRLESQPREQRLCIRPSELGCQHNHFSPGSLVWRTRNARPLREVTCEQVKVDSAQREIKKVRFLFYDPDSTLLFSGSVVSNSWDPVDCSPRCFSVHGISWARILEWVAISFSRVSSRPGFKPASPVSPALVGWCFTTEPPGKPQILLLLQRIVDGLC